MKIKMLTGLVTVGKDPVFPGETTDLPKHVAEAYIAAGSAELAGKKRGRPCKTEKAVQPVVGVERAVTTEG